MNYQPRFTVISGGTIYSPAPLGKKDVLIAAGVIALIDEQIEFSSSVPVERIDATGRMVFPGFIDLHVHVIGGGGEDGPGSRVPEIALDDLLSAGITTVVGVLGTDAITRSPESLLAKIKGLRAQGLTAYMYTGSYHVPSVTITGSVDRDIVLIEEVVGVKIAISDHRGSHPTLEELTRLASLARVGGMLGKKPGIVHVHIGSAPAGLAPILEVSQKSNIPLAQFLPTHVNRSQALLEQGATLVKNGGYIDLTAHATPDGGGTVDAIGALLDDDCDLSAVTISSDGNGSMPSFNDAGELVGMKTGSVGVLHGSFTNLVRTERLDIPTALELFTANPAKRLGLATRKGIIAVGADADIIVVDEDFEIDKVYARGIPLVDGGETIIRKRLDRAER